MSAYQWKSGSRIKADPQASGELMERLSATSEGLTARTLLEANRAEGTPLHDDYEWVDEVAAENWRLQQSNHFLNCITTVIVDTKTGEEVECRAVHITTESHKYEPLALILQDRDKYQTLLSNAKAELETFKRKYNTLKELTPVFEAIDEIEKES